MSRLLAARSPVGQPGCAVTLAPGGEVHLWQARWRARPDRTSATMTVARAVRHRRRWSTPFATSSVVASSIAADDASVVRLVLTQVIASVLTQSRAQDGPEHGDIVAVGRAQTPGAAGRGAPRFRADRQGHLRGRALVRDQESGVSTAAKGRGESCGPQLGPRPERRGTTSAGGIWDRNVADVDAV